MFGGSHNVTKPSCRRFTLERLTYGWKLAVNTYHYYDDGDTYSLCIRAAYTKSDFKRLEFFSETEITSDMNICRDCYSRRQTQMRQKIVTHHKETIGFWNDSKVCPNCKRKVIFWNSGTKEEHFCTVCEKMVVLA